MDKQEDSHYTYQYFTFCGRYAIRVVLNGNKDRIAAQGFDPKTATFFINNLLFRDLRSADTDQVTEAEFYFFCETLARRTVEGPGGPPRRN